MVFNGRPIQNDSTDSLGGKASNASGSLRETSAKANQELDNEVFGASSGLGYAPYFDKFHVHNGSYPNMYQDNQPQGQTASNHNSNYNLRRWQGRDVSHGGHARVYNQTFVDMNALQTPMPSSYHPPHLQNPNYFHQATGIAPPNYGQQVATNDFQYATPNYTEPGIQPAMTYRNHPVTSAAPADQSQNASSCQDSDLSDNHMDAKLGRPTRNLLEHEKVLLRQFYVMIDPSSDFQSRRKIQLWLLDGPVAVQNKWHSFLFANQTSAQAADRAASVEEHRALLQSLKEEAVAKIKSERRGNRFRVKGRKPGSKNKPKDPAAGVSKTSTARQGKKGQGKASLVQNYDDDDDAEEENQSDDMELQVSKKSKAKGRNKRSFG